MGRMIIRAKGWFVALRPFLMFIVRAIQALCVLATLFFAIEWFILENDSTAKLLIPLTSGAFDPLLTILNTISGVTLVEGLFKLLSKRASSAEKSISTQKALEKDKRNKQQLLKRVEEQWITGFLAESLHGGPIMRLDLERKPSAVNRPLDALVATERATDSMAPREIPIESIFEQAGGELLILGQAGSGKSTLLLELARDLVRVAFRDETQQIPIILFLSTWGEDRQPLLEWVVKELETYYGVPPTKGRDLLEHDELVLMLDGLNEVESEHQLECAQAINTFRREHGFTKMVVCCTTGEYDALELKLRLATAIEVQPLDERKLRNYFADAGDNFKSLADAVEGNNELRELAKSPLMLNLMMRTFDGESIPLRARKGTKDEWRKYLFSAYIERMLGKKNISQEYSNDQTLLWLSWLAERMRTHGQAIFLVEGLQPSWVASESWKRFYALCVALSFGMIIGPAWGLLWSMLGGLDPGLPIIEAIVAGLLRGLTVGLAGGLIFGLIYAFSNPSIATRHKDNGVFSERLFSNGDRIKLVESITLSWSEVRGIAAKNCTCTVAIFIVLIPVLLLLTSIRSIVVGDSLERVFSDTPMRLWEGLLGSVLFFLVMAAPEAFVVALSGKEISSTRRPGEGIWRSLFSGLKVTIGALIILVPIVAAQTEAMGMTANYGISDGVAFALALGLLFGGKVVIQHFILRLIFTFTKKIPWNYVQFLNYAVRRTFLTKVGGGYRFQHPLLMTYFAEYHN